jgi:hypothetical protein
VVLRPTLYEVAPADAFQVRETCPFFETAVTEGAAGGMQLPVGVTETSGEFIDSQVKMVLTEDTT